MKTLFKEGNKELFGISIFLILMGVLLIALNLRVLASVMQVLGFFMMGSGIGLGLLFLFGRYEFAFGSLLLAIISFISGFMFAKYPGQVLAMESIITGILLIINGILHIRSALYYREFHFPYWLQTLIGGILIGIIGIFFIWQPINSLQWTLRLSGIMLILDGVSIAFVTYLFDSHLKQTEYIEGDYTENEDTLTENEEKTGNE